MRHIWQYLTLAGSASAKVMVWFAWLEFVVLVAIGVILLGETGMGFLYLLTLVAGIVMARWPVLRFGRGRRR